MTLTESQTQSPLVKQLGLLRHPEGGGCYHYRWPQKCQSSQDIFEKPTDAKTKYPARLPMGGSRSLATSIYYLLDYNSPSGVIHMNKSVTYHVLHQGRAEYTLITPGNPPLFERKIIGTGPNETRQLFVGTGVWKMSRLLPEDVERAKTDEEKKALCCLITEVVVPGFHWEDHQFMTRKMLEEVSKDFAERETLLVELTDHCKA